MTDRVLNIYWDDVQKKARRSKGSAEHFWHFMFGYFLPLMRFLLQQERADLASLRLYDCGPLMNRIVIEGLSHLRLRPDFDKSLFVESDLQICIQRLDASGAGGRCPARRIRMDRSEATSIVLDRWDVWLARGNVLDALKPLLLETRDAVAAMLAPWSCCRRHLAEGKYLILQRSAEPSFYQAAGGAKVETYGTGRRCLLGIKEGQAQLEALGAPSLIYEPGAHNLACQINHFSVCTGVIGVRGAEFANALWMPAAAKIIMFLSSGLSNRDPPARSLARLLGHDYYEIPHQGEISPSMDISRIIHHL